MNFDTTSIFLETRLQTAISDLFGALDATALRAVRACFEWVEIPGGHYLFRQGDQGDSLYVVAAGRLQVLRKRSPGLTDHLGHIAVGETVGEMALISGEPRTADIMAMRDTMLARLSKEHFEALAQQHPRALLHISRSIIERLQNRNKAKHAPKRISNLCLLPISDGIDTKNTAKQVVQGLAPHGTVLLLDRNSVHSAPAQMQDGIYKPMQHGLSAWLEEQESLHRFVVYLPDPEDTEWTRRCLRQADEILLLADASQAADLRPIERQLLRGEGRITSAGQRLILFHAPESIAPTNTRAWLAKRDLIFYHHLRKNDSLDFARLGRFLSGNAVGLVLSGGAARGFAHIGVYRALEEAGIPVDLVGGTSIGAVMSALVARKWTGQHIREHCRRVFRTNPTSDFSWLPWISIFKGKKLDRLLRENFGDQRIEDSWLSSFCISCNLTKIHPHIHRSGRLLDSLRASISIPGVFPPAEFQNDLHVDGGVFNNMPVDVMSALGVGTLIAVDLQTNRTQDKLEPLGKKQKRRAPNLLFVVMESTMLSGRYRTQEYKKEVDLYFNPPLREFSLMDWHKFDQIEAIGYRHAKEVLEKSAIQ